MFRVTCIVLGKSCARLVTVFVRPKLFPRRAWSAIERVKRGEVESRVNKRSNVLFIDDSTYRFRSVSKLFQRQATIEYSFSDKETSLCFLLRRAVKSTAFRIIRRKYTQIGREFSINSTQRRLTTFRNAFPGTRTYLPNSSTGCLRILSRFVAKLLAGLIGKALPARSCFTRETKRERTSEQIYAPEIREGASEAHSRARKLSSDRNIFRAT